jgi:hypothetical protein
VEGLEDMARQSRTTLTRAEVVEFIGSIPNLAAEKDAAGNVKRLTKQEIASRVAEAFQESALEVTKPEGTQG